MNLIKTYTKDKIIFKTPSWTDEDEDIFTCWLCGHRPIDPEVICRPKDKKRYLTTFTRRFICSRCYTKTKVYDKVRFASYRKRWLDIVNVAKAI